MRLSGFSEIEQLGNDDLVPVSREIEGGFETRNIKVENLKHVLGSEGVAPDVITDLYNPSGTYYAGDFCMYGTELYKCISAVNPQKDAYIVGETMYASDWLSLTSGGTAISQTLGTADPINYKIATTGTELTGRYFKWDEYFGVYNEATLFEEFTPAKWQKVQLGNLAFKDGAAVIITPNDTTPPTDTSVLWVYPG